MPPRKCEFWQKSTFTELVWQTKQHHNAHFLLQLQVRNAVSVQFTWCPILPGSPVVVTTEHCTPLILPRGLTVACSSVKLPQFLFLQGKWLILHDRNSWLSVLQLCTVNLCSSSISMLFLITSPCEEQLSWLSVPHFSKTLGLFP